MFLGEAAALTQARARSKSQGRRAMDDLQMAPSRIAPNHTTEQSPSEQNTSFQLIPNQASSSALRSRILWKFFR